MKGIIFDLDGVLINSAPDMAVSINRTLENFGFSTIDKDLIPRNFGLKKGLPQWIAKCCLIHWFWNQCYAGLIVRKSDLFVLPLFVVFCKKKKVQNLSWVLE